MPVSIWLAAAVGAVATWLQLYIRFHERRVFETPKTAIFFVLIGVFAGVVSGALTAVLPVEGEVASAAVGLGTSVSFSQTPEASLDTASTRATSEITKLLKKLLFFTSIMSRRLDSRLSAAKDRKVAAVINEINHLSQGDAHPPFEGVNRVLRVLVSYRTGEERGYYQGKRKAAYKDSKSRKAPDEPLEPLISLAYDMGQEGAVLDRVREHARPSQGPPPAAPPAQTP